MVSVDLLVIGGGINGTAIAAAAARRGLSVLLVEKGDLGSGTSAASSKLIHGGLRYLQYGEFGLVRESLRDRELLLRTRPHLVRPIELLIPVRVGDPVPAWKLEAGLFLYDRLAASRQLPFHRRLSREETLAREPHLEPVALRGGFVYPDAQIVYPERLCVELAREAAEAGAIIRTYTELIGIRRQEGRVVGASLGLPETDHPEPIAARLTVNAAGPWVDAVCQLLGEPRAPLLGGTKGSHLVARRPAAGPRGPLYAAAESDGRPFFVLPWREMLLIGTTDMRYQGDPSEAAVETFEIEYLLRETATLFPSAQLTEDEIIYTYAGVRPLPASRSAAARITRRHQIVDHGVEGAAGFWSIVGGKLTTHPTLAEQVVDRAIRWLGEPTGKACSGPRSFAVSTEGSDVETFRRSADSQAAGLGLEARQIEYLAGLYGPRAGAVIDRVRRNRALSEQICPRNPDIAAQVEEAVEREWAVTLADFLLRRTGIGSSPCLGLDCAQRAAQMMGRAAGWDESRQAREIGEYQALIERRCRIGGAD
jgi:glycerol-3-phosphate dehydrogenase